MCVWRGGGEGVAPAGGDRFSAEAGYAPSYPCASLAAASSRKMAFFARSSVSGGWAGRRSARGKQTDWLAGLLAAAAHQWGGPLLDLLLLLAVHTRRPCCCVMRLGRSRRRHRSNAADSQLLNLLLLSCRARRGRRAGGVGGCCGAAVASINEIITYLLASRSSGLVVRRRSSAGSRTHGAMSFRRRHQKYGCSRGGRRGNVVRSSRTTASIIVPRCSFVAVIFMRASC